MDIADRIRQLRGEMTREQFSKRTGIAPQTLYKYETRTGKVSLESAVIICKSFRINYEWFISGNGPMSMDEGQEETHASAPLETDICPRCEKMEKRLETVEEERRQTSEKLVDTLQTNVALVTELGELKLENVKLSQELETARQMCREYAAALKEAGGADPLFDERRNIPSSESTLKI